MIRFWRCCFCDCRYPSADEMDRHMLVHAVLDKPKSTELLILEEVKAIRTLLEEKKTWQGKEEG